MEKMVITVDPYIGFNEHGLIEFMFFIGTSDTPVLSKYFNLSELADEFISVRTANGKFDENYTVEKDKLIQSLQEAIARLQKA